LRLGDYSGDLFLRASLVLYCFLIICFSQCWRPVVWPTMAILTIPR